MSGGHWGFVGWKLNEILSDIGGDVDVRIRFPQISRVFLELGDMFERVHDELDRDLSGDEGIVSDYEFEKEFMEKMRFVVSYEADMENINNEICKIEQRLIKIKENEKLE